MNAIRDEVEACASLHRDRIASVIREYKDGSVVDRIVAPPSFPTVVKPGAAGRSKHVAAYDPGSDALKSL